EQAYPSSQKKLGGIPLISILGVLSFIVSCIFIYGILSPAIGNVGWVLLTGIIPTFLLGAVIYAIAWAVRKNQGIDLSALQKQIPPE
ncbi:MAG TPA: hypothetical protein VED86_07145, partial [archaeon]|nr:hypothetical protein [archaeon]